MDKSPGQKALQTAKWARTMTKWLISFNQRTGARWRIVDFCGPTAESRGIVDLMAVRKDHREFKKNTKRGDLLEIVLIQCKGGAALRPSAEDVRRLREVKSHHRAQRVVLAEWKRGQAPQLLELRGSQWRETTVSEVFS